MDDQKEEIENLRKQIKGLKISLMLTQISRDTEKAATELFEKLKVARDVNVNNETIKFFQPLYDVQDVGTDDAGIYEMVIEGVFIYEKKEGKQA